VSPELSLLIGSIVGGTGALLSFWAGWRARDRHGPPRGSYGPPRDRSPDWRRSFNHENTNRPSGPPPLRPRRRNPFVSDFQQQINDALDLDGYRSINYPDPSPDRRPTNPFNGEPVTFTEGRIQRGNGSGGPTTPKPQPAGGRLIGADGMTIGYRPIPSRPNPAPTHPHASHDLSAFI
jgi:hypothetical protein